MHRRFWLAFPLLSLSLATDGNAVFSVPQVPKPAYMAPFTDPKFKTTVDRIAGDPGTAIHFRAGGTGTWGKDARHHYQSDQAWNSDSTLLMLQNSGTPSQVILDGTTYQPKYGKCRNYSNYDDRWLEGRPHERMNVNGKLLEWFDVVACTRTRSWTLPFAHTNDYEMGPSRDGRFIALGNSTSAFVVDMDPQPPLQTYSQGNRRIGPARNVSDCGLSSGCTIDSINISPSGAYVVIRYAGDYQRVFDVNPATLALTVHRFASGTVECSGRNPANGFILDLGHADMTFNPYSNNDEVIVGQKRSWCPSTINGIAQGHIQMVRLRDGQVKSLTKPANESSSYHISARNFDRPGWVYASYWPSPGRRFDDEIIAVKLDGSYSVERYVHDHTDTSGCYRCESHPVPSRDGERILFASSWSYRAGGASGSQSNPQEYVVSSPEP
jgi:hypothetical protein